MYHIRIRLVVCFGSILVDVLLRELLLIRVCSFAVVENGWLIESCGA